VEVFQKCCSGWARVQGRPNFEALIKHLDETPFDHRMLWYEGRNENEYLCVRVAMDPSTSRYNKSQWQEAMAASYQQTIASQGMIYDPSHFPGYPAGSFAEHYYNAGDVQHAASAGYAYGAPLTGNYSTRFPTGYPATYPATYPPAHYQSGEAGFGGDGYGSAAYFPDQGETAAQGAVMSAFGALTWAEPQQYVDTERKKVVFTNLPRQYDEASLKEFIYGIIGHNDDWNHKRNIGMVLQTHSDGRLKSHAFGMCRTYLEATEVVAKVNDANFRGHKIRVSITSEGVHSRQQTSRTAGVKDGEGGKGKGKGKGGAEDEKAAAQPGFYETGQPVVVDGTSKKAAAQKGSSKGKGKQRSDEYHLPDRTRRQG
jgi:hypothetical protein